MVVFAKQVLSPDSHITGRDEVVETSIVFVKEMTALASKERLIARLCYTDLFSAYIPCAYVL